jgi:hypothetical protein
VIVDAADVNAGAEEQVASAQMRNAPLPPEMETDTLPVIPVMATMFDSRTELRGTAL